jgi:hypothetical protein
MFRTWLVFPLICLGCSDPLPDRLHGRWFGDSLVNVDAEYLAAATGWARGTSFEFTGSNVTITIPTEMPRTAPYEVVKAEDDSVTIAVRRDDGRLDMATLTFVRTHLLRWYIGEGRAMLMRRSE